MTVKRPPVILLCGQLCTERLWREQVAALQALCDVTISVQRAHDNVGAMARAILDSQPERFSIIAHAMGGFVAFEVLVITAALLRRRSELQRHARPAAPAPAPAV